MYKADRKGHVLLVIVAIIALLSAGGLLYFMFLEQAKRVEAEQKLSQSENARRAVEKELNSKQLQLVQVQDQAKIFAEQFEQEKRNYQIALEQIEEKDFQVKKLEGILTEEREKSTGLDQELTQLRDVRDSLEDALRDAKNQIDELKGRLGESTTSLDKSPVPLKQSSSAGVELKKIVVKPKDELEGKVLVVNNKFQFIVIDLGEKHGVNVGDDFVVYKDAQEVARVQVEAVYDAMSTASILSDSQPKSIKEDCIVKSF